MNLEIQDDRLLKISRDANNDQDWDQALARLNRAAIVISAGSNLGTRAGHAAAIALATCGSRMFRGGVYLEKVPDEAGQIGARPFKSLRHELAVLGCRQLPPPVGALRIHIGTDCPGDAGDIWCWTNGWLAASGPRPHSETFLPGNELSGALAGAMAASEAFRRLIFNDARAGRRTQQLSPYRPESPVPEEATIKRLPASLWILGMGNLGQANLMLASLLPYVDTSAVRLVIHDLDKAAKENLDVQVLTTPDWIGHRKARMAAAWADSYGFDTRVCELPFSETTVRSIQDPPVAIVGVDNLPTRRAAAREGARFGLVVDAGLGASAAEIFDIRIHSFPGARTAAQAWPESRQEERELPPAYEKLITSGKLDRCGAVTLFGQSVGVPSTAMAAAAIQLSQVCRVLAEGDYADYLDVSTTTTKNLEVSVVKAINPAALPAVDART